MVNKEEIPYFVWEAWTVRLVFLGILPLIFAGSIYHDVTSDLEKMRIEGNLEQMNPNDLRILYGILLSLFSLWNIQASISNYPKWKYKEAGG